MSSLACSTLAVQNGAEPVMQIAARDRTRIGLQSECVRGLCVRHPQHPVPPATACELAPNPRGRLDVVDLDSIQMLWICAVCAMKVNIWMVAIKFPPKSSWRRFPFASGARLGNPGEEKKVNAGAQFFQTNLVHDPDGLEVWLNELAKRDILDKVYILVGITPLKSLKVAQYMHNEVPGVKIPEKLMKRWSSAGDGAEEERQIALS